MPAKKRFELSRTTRNAKRVKQIRRSEDPEVRLEKLKKIREAARARRAAETPEQKESRRQKNKIHQMKKRNAKLAALDRERRNAVLEAIKCSQNRKEISDIEDAERNVALGKQKVNELQDKLREQASKGHESEENYSVTNLCVVEIENENN